MRRSTRALGFVVASGLLVVACSGDHSSTTDTAIPATASSGSAAFDTTTKDRDRNVATSNFGENGGGIASVRVTENMETRFENRVFRRIRWEYSAGRRLADSRDVFVVTKVSRTVSGKVSTTLHVDGFTTVGDDPATYPMRGFGDAGRVSIKMPDKSGEWVAAPNAYTVVSRDLLAVSFPTARTDGDAAGLIEFYDLPSGRPNTTLGKKGRIVVPKSMGIDDVYDIALREIGDDGKPRLVVGGLAYDASNDSYTETDVAIVGVTADGKPDSAVGTAGSGTISLRNSLAGFGTNSVWGIRLADPGLGTPKGAIGAAVTSWIPGPTRKAGQSSPDAVELTGLMARAPRSGGPITMDAANGAYVNSIRPDVESVRLRNVIIDIDGSLDIHMMSLFHGTGYAPPTAHHHDAVTFRSASPTGGVTLRPIPIPFRQDSISLSPRGEFIADLSSVGKQFSVEIYNDTSKRRTSSVTCFDDNLCNVGEVPAVRKLSDISPAEGSSTTVRAMRVDAGGSIHLLVQTTRTLVGVPANRIFSFVPDGSALAGEPPAFRGDFDTNDFEEVDVDNQMMSNNVRWVDAANILTGRRLAATGSTRRDFEPNVVLVSDAGDDPREVPLSLPLGVSSYSADKRAVTMIDDSSLALRADVFSDSGREIRLYKVNVENGSVDIGFATNGYVTVPGIRRDDDCRWDEVLESGPAVVGLLVIDHDPQPIDGMEACSPVPQTVSWMAFTTAGEAVGKVVAAAELDPVGFARVSDYMVDGQGNLYVVGYRDVLAGTGHVTSIATVAKFTPTGSLDTTFASKGVASFDGTTNARFSTGTELIGAVDANERVYLAGSTTDIPTNVEVLVMRLDEGGVIDGTTSTVTPDVAAPRREDITPQKARETANTEREAMGAAEAVAMRADERQAALPVDSGITVVAKKPMLTAVKAVVDRSLTVWWSQQATKQGYVTATALPGGRTCTSKAGSCIIRGLDPSVAYTVTVSPMGEETSAPASSTGFNTKPVVIARVGRIASPTAYVRPASRGRATWNVRGGCALTESDTRVTMPKRATTCQLGVTTEKFGSTPVTTRSVTIVVKR